MNPRTKVALTLYLKLSLILLSISKVTGATTPPACFLACTNNIAQWCAFGHSNVTCVCSNHLSLLGCLTDVCEVQNFIPARDHFWGTCSEHKIDIEKVTNQTTLRYINESNFVTKPAKEHASRVSLGSNRPIEFIVNNNNNSGAKIERHMILNSNNSNSQNSNTAGGFVKSNKGNQTSGSNPESVTYIEQILNDDFSHMYGEKNQVKPQSLESDQSLRMMSPAAATKGAQTERNVQSNSNATLRTQSVPKLRTKKTIPVRIIRKKRVPAIHRDVSQQQVTRQHQVLEPAAPRQERRISLDPESEQAPPTPVSLQSNKQDLNPLPSKHLDPELSISSHVNRHDDVRYTDTSV